MRNQRALGLKVGAVFFVLFGILIQYHSISSVVAISEYDLQSLGRETPLFYLAITDLLGDNIVPIIIILVELVIIISITVWFFYTRHQFLKLTNRSLEMEKVAKEANEAKGEFLANMSHEIRTPMSAVIGLSTLMDSTDLTPRQREYNNRLKSSAVNLLGIINNILDYSKIEAKQMNLENIEFDLNDVLYNLSNVVTLKANEKNIEFLFNIKPDLPPRYIGDPLRLGQILINIVSNAIKFTEKGQVVLLIKSAMIDDQFHLNFVIKDSGIGMSKEEIDKIIKPFTQADSSFTRKYGGTGLGLSITNQLIQIMGGKLHISSDIDVGSTFSFTLPFKPMTEVKKDTHVPQALHQLNVLLVDDNTVSLSILEDICKSLGFITKKASSAEQAISVLKDTSFTPDMFIIDYGMPDINGVELAQTLKKKRLLKKAKVLLMISIYNDENIFQEAYDAGIYDFLDKPINPSLFFDTLVSIYNKEEVKQQGQPSKSTVDLVKPGTCIILAEDNVINQQIVNELLTKEGFDVTIANNGQEVLDLLRKAERDYKLVLMDIQMPLLNGREATRIIRNTKTKYQDIPIVAMTAHALEDERQKSLAAGMNDFLTKPVEIKQLFRVLSKYVDIVTVSVDSTKMATVDLDFLDTETGIKNVSGDAAFYIEILYNFYNDYKAFNKALDLMVKEEDDQDVLIEVHTLKGLAATIGATKLHEYTKDFEASLKQGNFDPEKYKKLSTTLEKLIKNMEQYFNANPFKNN